MSSGKWRPFCLGLNVLKYQQLTIATKATLKFTRSAYTLQNPKQHNTTKIPRVDGNAEIENTDAKKKDIEESATDATFASLMSIFPDAICRVISAQLNFLLNSISLSHIHHIQTQ